MKITVGYLYPGLMSADGDRGNIGAIVRRCGWRNISVAVTELRLGDKVTPGELDIIMIGGGAVAAAPGRGRPVQDQGRRHPRRGRGRRGRARGRRRIRAVRPLLPARETGAELRGIELFDSWTIRRDDVTGHHDALARRAPARISVTGDLVVRWGGSLLVGFETSQRRHLPRPGRAAARPGRARARQQRRRQRRLHHRQCRRNQPARPVPAREPGRWPTSSSARRSPTLRRRAAAAAGRRPRACRARRRGPARVPGCTGPATGPRAATASQLPWPASATACPPRR